MRTTTSSSSRVLPRRTTFGIIVLTLLAFHGVASQAREAAEGDETPSKTPPPGTEQQIAGALSAAPEDRRAAATIYGYSPKGRFEVLRQGTNEIVCIADNPTDDRFQASCYHESLEPYMERGRQLRAEGVEGPETLRLRHEEADAGKLEMPSAPAALYNLGGPLEIFDSETGAVTGGRWVWSVYTPYATEASTGLPTTPQGPGAPWIMRPGTASSHLMIVQPREPARSEDEPDKQQR